MTMLSNSRYRNRDEAGFSLMEVVVTTSILMIVMTAILSTLELATRQERRTTAVVDNQNTVMVAFNRITRELRGANPIEWSAVVNSSEFERSITFWVGSTSGNDRKQWRFRIDSSSTTSELVAECLSGCVPAGSGLPDVPSREVLIPRLLNSNSEPLFQYYSGYSDGDVLTTTAGSPNQVNPQIVSVCTVRIVIRIRSGSEGGAPVYDASTDAEIRNSIPGGVSGYSGGISGVGC